MSLGSSSAEIVVDLRRFRAPWPRHLTSRPAAATTSGRRRQRKSLFSSPHRPPPLPQPPPLPWWSAEASPAGHYRLHSRLETAQPQPASRQPAIGDGGGSGHCHSRLASAALAAGASGDSSEAAASRFQVVPQRPQSRFADAGAEELLRLALARTGDGSRQSPSLPPASSGAQAAPC
eukprot:gnl/TRDRNA2_/TRDRNA2_165615_c0_seq1.p2 gnl/TRDRNA2_/TRDRNA2_165615_c0~~gnl/TRDRNA2_/TRDRNA2_165615_c0_seq1.p2  ORF type:complete len:177 (-),score=24.35 gnl/TRDRNA2_/TRDRNA2_165615_c0_seq1:76-606(-)